MLMGLCDLVPGVSGSSMAYLCGVYENLVEAVSAPKRHLTFLASLGAGIILSLITFALPLNLVMHNTIARSLLLSFFIGLSIACALRALFEGQGNRQGDRQSPWQTKESLLFLLFGVLSSSALNSLPSIEASLLSYPNFFFAGTAAGIAMLLPAISGAQVLYLLGLYPFIIENLAHFVATGNSASFLVLSYLGLGVFCGLFIASKLMRFFFARFSHGIHKFFAGFIFMALPRLWPFQTIVPNVAWAWQWSAAALLALGLALGFGLGQLTKKRVV